MKIEMIGSSILRILIGKQELEKYNVTYQSLDYKNIETRRLMLYLLDTAKSQTGFDPKHQRLFVEAFPDANDGCILYLSIMQKEEKEALQADKITLLPICQPATKGLPQIFEFDSIIALDHAIRDYLIHQRSLITDSELYLINKRYQLVVYAKPMLRENLSATLSEYGKYVGKGALRYAYTVEHSKTILEQNAIDTLYELSNAEG